MYELQGFSAQNENSRQNGRGSPGLRRRSGGHVQESEADDQEETDIPLAYQQLRFPTPPMDLEYKYDFISDRPLLPHHTLYEQKGNDGARLQLVDRELAN
ncbi:hypothetical protein WR25_20217 [Diploscapter pachys]|uniref:Uncharacterized protein n=1 Tax=Diploscapter pachys TaxID=2018661 RepID=A0A2A2LQS8_9BILA|nr:hypothetical protein WR25_20217 [Diploscapter pachys]